jgi:hypothetical protein
MVIADAALTQQQIVLTVAIVALAVPLILVRAWAPPAAPAPARRGPRGGATPKPSAATAVRAVPPGRRFSRETKVCGLVALWVLGLLLWRNGDPIGVRPDSWSDANVIIGGWNYARSGLGAHYGATQLQVVTDTHPSDPYFLYTQYPAGPIWINGVLQLCHITAERAFRVLPGLCSLAGLGLWFLICRRVVNATVAMLAVVAMGTSYVFLAYADCLHFHAYSLCAALGVAYCFVRGAAPEMRRRWLWLGLCLLLVFITAWLTWEYHLWLVLFFGLYGLLFKLGIRRWWLPVFGLPLIAALVLQVAQQRAVLREVSQFSNVAGTDPPISFADDLYRRTLGFEQAVDTPKDLTLAGYPRFLLARYFNLFGVPVLGMLALALVVLSAERRWPHRISTWGPGERLLVVLLVAGAGWWLTMMQHTSVHQHTMRQGLTAFALLFALVWARCARLFKSDAYHPAARMAAAALCLVLAFVQLEGVAANLRVHSRAWATAPGPESWFAALGDRERGDGVWAERDVIAPFADLLPADAVVLTSYNRYPQVRYFTRRAVYQGALLPYRPHVAAPWRLALDRSFNHLRQLYGERLPPLYYAYYPRPDWRLIPLGELFLGRPIPPAARSPAERAAIEADLAQVEELLRDAYRRGRSDRTFCPVIGATSYGLLFQADKLVPLLMEEYGSMGFPTARQFGPPR